MTKHGLGFGIGESEEIIPILLSESVNVKKKKHVDGEVFGVGSLRGGLKKGRSREEGSLKRQVGLLGAGVAVSRARASVGVLWGDETRIVNDRDS